MDTYSLKVTNDSANSTTFAMYLQGPTLSVGNTIFTLAWQCKYCPPQGTVNFSWQLKYNAIVSQPGDRLAVGVVCDVRQAKEIRPLAMKTQDEALMKVTSSQIFEVDLDGINTSTLSYLPEHNAFQFGPWTNGTADSISTNCDASVPNSLTTSSKSVAGVGTGIDGSGAFIVGAQPNMNFIWKMEPLCYYLVTGNYKTGEILDLNTIQNIALKVSYNQILNHSAILNSNNQLKLSDEN
jgi:hypothetical protein